MKQIVKEGIKILTKRNIDSRVNEIELPRSLEEIEDGCIKAFQFEKPGSISYSGTMEEFEKIKYSDKENDIMCVECSDGLKILKL